MSKFVNMHQTKEERRQKYGVLICEGFDWIHARRMRDWRWLSIIGAIENLRLSEAWQLDQAMSQALITG